MSKVKWSLGRAGKQKQVTEGGRRGEDKYGALICLDLSVVLFIHSSKGCSTS